MAASFFEYGAAEDRAHFCSASSMACCIVFAILLISAWCVVGIGFC
jgi:hypothetical protein